MDFSSLARASFARAPPDSLLTGERFGRWGLGMISLQYPASSVMARQFRMVACTIAAAHPAAGGGRPAPVLRARNLRRPRTADVREWRRRADATSAEAPPLGVDRLPLRQHGAANQSDVLAQRVGLAREARRDLDEFRGVLDAVEVAQPLLDRQLSRPHGDVPLE